MVVVEEDVVVVEEDVVVVEEDVVVVEEDAVVVKEDVVEEEEEEMWDNMVRGDLIGTIMIKVLLVVISQIIITSCNFTNNYY